MFIQHCLLKFIIEQIISVSKRKTISTSIFQLGKIGKQLDQLGKNILKQLPEAQANQITTKVLSTAKNPANYYDRVIEKNEQAPIDIKITDDIKMINERPTMVSVNNAVDENANKKRVEKRKMLEKQLSENTLRMKQIKKTNKLKIFLIFIYLIKIIVRNISYIQLPYGYVKNNKQIQLNLPRGYEESQYLKEVSYLTNKNPTVENSLLNLLRNRDDLKKWLLATGEYGNEIQEDLNAIIGFDEKFNNAIVRRALDLKDQAIFCNRNPINVTFHDMKKFDLVNPVIGKLASQV